MAIASARYNTIAPNVTYTLHDYDGYHEAIDENHGIGRDWSALDDIELTGNTQVFNHKDVIGQSYEKSKDLLFRLKLLKAIGSLDSQLSVEIWSMQHPLPATTLAFAVDSMDKVVKQAKETKKQEREEMIADFVGAVLFFVPLFGEAVDASMAAIRSALEMVEVAGEVGLLTYKMVKDPDNALMAVFSTLAGAGLSRESWSRAAEERRGMEVEDAAKLGSVKTELDKIDTA